MNFYQQEVERLQSLLYPKEYLSQQVIQSKQFIDKHYYDNINLGDIAGKAFFSKFHFIRLFKSYYGCTPCQYLAEVRLAEAKKLLALGVSAKHACLSVGFDSIPSFTRLFKKITGYTPAAFRKK